MSKKLLVKISKRKSNGVESWEGTVSLPGIQPTKLTKAKSNESKFSTRTALTSAAQRLAERLSFEVEFEGVSAEKKPRSSKKNEEAESL